MEYCLCKAYYNGINCNINDDILSDLIEGIELLVSIASDTEIVNDATGD